MPKIHYMDNGVLQAVLQKKGGITGSEFESLVIAEIHKQIATISAQVQTYHLRTYDGKEVDLLIEMPDHYLAFEIKKSNRVTSYDARNMLGLEDVLNKPLKKAFLLSNDRDTKVFDDKIIAINTTLFLG